MYQLIFQNSVNLSYVHHQNHPQLVLCGVPRIILPTPSPYKLGHQTKETPPSLHQVYLSLVACYIQHRLRLILDTDKRLLEERRGKKKNEGERSLRGRFTQNSIGEILPTVYD